MMKTKICIALVLVIAVLTGCSSLSSGKIVSTVSVTGSATVNVVPDTASFSITAESTEATTEEARNTSSMMIEKAIALLKDEFAITDESLATDYIQVNPYYEWVDSGRKLVGQKATQRLTITLTGDSLNKVGKVYDRLSVLDGISISTISYSKLDTSAELEEARGGAAKAAFKKAEAYANSLGKKVGDVISVSDGSGVSYRNVSYASPKMMMAEATAADYSSTTVYQGDITISDSVTVVFTLAD